MRVETDLQSATEPPSDVPNRIGASDRPVAVFLTHKEGVSLKMGNKTNVGKNRSAPESAVSSEHEAESAETSPELAQAADDLDEGAKAYITALQAEVEDLRSRIEDMEKRLIYSQAEFQNISKRREEQYRGDMRYANSELIKSLLPVLDNFERALKAAEQTRNYDALIGGVSGTLKQLLAALEKAGVRPIEALGKEFDPVYHEAIGHTEESDLPANTVAEEVQRGYFMHDRVLRPALVKVSEG